MSKNIFFNQLTLVILESILQMTMAIYLFIFSEYRDNSKLDIFPLITTICCIILISLILSFEMFVLIVPKEILTRRSVYRRLSYLYKDLRLEKKLNLWYYMIFVLRRIILCLIFLRGQSYPSQQIQILLYINLTIFVYIGNVTPFKSKSQNRKEMFNEFLIVLLTL